VYLFLGVLWSVWFDGWQMPEDDASSPYSKNFLIFTFFDGALHSKIDCYLDLLDCWTRAYGIFPFSLNAGFLNFFSKSAEIQNPWRVSCFAKSQTGTNDVTKLLPLSSAVQWRKTCRLQWFFVSGCFLAFCSFISLQVSFSSTKLYDMAKCRYLRLQFIGK